MPSTDRNLQSSAGHAPNSPTQNCNRCVVLFGSSAGGALRHCSCAQTRGSSLALSIQTKHFVPFPHKALELIVAGAVEAFRRSITTILTTMKAANVTATINALKNSSAFEGAVQYFAYIALICAAVVIATATIVYSAQAALVWVDRTAYPGGKIEALRPATNGSFAMLPASAPVALAATAEATATFRQ